MMETYAALLMIVVTSANAVCDGLIQKYMDAPSTTMRRRVDFFLYPKLCRLSSKLCTFFPEWADWQWLWHGLKVLHFYPPLLWVGISAGFDVWDWLAMAASCLILWRALYVFTKGERSS